MRKFNSGNGADVCDRCGAMLQDGIRVIKAHRVLSHPGSQSHYCDHRCMQEHAFSDKSMHRAMVILLAQESERLRLLAILKLDGELLQRMTAALASRQVDLGNTRS